MKSFWSEITKVHVPENNVDSNSTSGVACEADICQLAVSFTFNNNDLMIKVILVEFTFFTGTFIQESESAFEIVPLTALKNFMAPPSIKLLLS